MTLNFLSSSFSIKAGRANVSPRTTLKSCIPCKNIFIRAMAEASANLLTINWQTRPLPPPSVVAHS